MMNRKELKQYIQNTFNVNPDYPWVKQPDNEVFRHNSNKNRNLQKGDKKSFIYPFSLTSHHDISPF